VTGKTVNVVFFRAPLQQLQYRDTKDRNNCFGRNSNWHRFVDEEIVYPSTTRVIIDEVMVKAMINSLRKIKF